MPEFAFPFHNAFFTSERLQRNVNVAMFDLSGKTITVGHAGFLVQASYWKSMSCSRAGVLNKGWKILLPEFVVCAWLYASCYQHNDGKKTVWAICNWGQVTYEY